MKEWWWRVRYCWHFRKATRWPWSHCWAAAWAGDYDPVYTPAEAVDDEVVYYAAD